MVRFSTETFWLSFISWTVSVGTTTWRTEQVLVPRRDAVLEVLLDLLLVAGVGVDDVPAEHGFQSSSVLEDGVDERFPQRIEQAEVAACDHDEAEDDGGRLADLPAVGPLHAAQLVECGARGR